MRCDHLHDSAAYVLGALSPPEREAYEQHLVECSTCRTEVAELAMLPGLLGRLDLATAQAIAVSGEDAMTGVIGTMPAPGPDARDTSESSEVPGAPGWAGPTFTGQHPEPAESTAESTVAPVEGLRDPLLPRIVDRAKTQRRSERRRRRWQTAGTALVAACLGVLAVLGVRAAGIGGPPDLTAMREVAGVVPITAQLALESFSGGTKVHMHCSYKPDAKLPATARWTYKLVVIPKSGDTQEIASWTAGFGDEYELTGRSAIARDQVQRVELRKGDGTLLLLYEP